MVPLFENYQFVGEMYFYVFLELNVAESRIELRQQVPYFQENFEIIDLNVA